ncbi:MAG: GNAT family N-acetyltransferase [Burkholderiaceae bacterium]
MNLVIRPALEAEAPILSDLALRSKAYWGYDEAFMAACREELSVAPADIAQAPWPYMVGTGEPADLDKLLGFYALGRLGPQQAELEALFVDPSLIGQGVGRQLISHAMNVLRLSGIKSLKIQSDPSARPFYERMGAIRIGESPSGSIKGRLLPVLGIELAAPI